MKGKMKNNGRIFPRKFPAWALHGIVRLSEKERKRRMRRMRRRNEPNDWNKDGKKK